MLQYVILYNRIPYTLYPYTKDMYSNTVFKNKMDMYIPETEKRWCKKKQKHMSDPLPLQYIQ